MRPACFFCLFLSLVAVEPEADRILWLHVRVLLVLDQGEGRGLCVGPYQ